MKAQACGTPAIAFRKGISLEARDRTGQCRKQTHDRLFFDEQTVPVVIDAPEGYEASDIHPRIAGPA
jgi:hypothetical protein